MAKYICQCGMFLKNVPIKTDKRPIMSYKVLIVRTERHYKCPNGCILTKVQTIK